MTDPSKRSDTPRVSVIVPVKDDAARLRLCLEALSRQSLAPDTFEVILVDNGSTKDDPRSEAARFPGVRFETESAPGPAAARNRGVAASRGQALAFTDADCQPEPEWLAEGLKALASLPNGGMAAGRVLAVPRDPAHPSILEWFDRFYYFDQEGCLARWHFALTANLFVSRTMVESIGVFDTRFHEAAGEDVDFGQRAWRAGWPQVYAAAAVVRHPAMAEAAAFWRRQEREEDDALVALEFGAAPDNPEEQATTLLRQACSQLDDYFDGRRRAFELPLRPTGTVYQQRVWARLVEIPYGRTESYGALSATLGTAPRALAGACATNPLPILIPCHRVIAARGMLGGYSGGDGVETKRALLRLEGALAAGLPAVT